MPAMPAYAAPRQMPALTPEQLSSYSFEAMTSGELQKLLDVIDTQITACGDQGDELVKESASLVAQFDEADAEIANQKDNLAGLVYQAREIEDMIGRLRASKTDINRQIAEMQAVADELMTQIAAFQRVRSEIEAVISGRNG